MATADLMILVVDDHALVREGMRQILKGLADQVEVIEASSCERAFTLISKTPELDLVMLDYHLPDMNGLEALDHLRQTHPELPVLVVSGSVNPRIARQVLQKGAAAFLTKSGDSSELLQAIRRVINGEIVVSQVVSEAERQVPVDVPQFTPRQMEVLFLLIDGLSNKEIGRALALSDETVKNHVSAILRGFGVQTRAQAAAEAQRWGFRRPSDLTPAS